MATALAPRVKSIRLHEHPPMPSHYVVRLTCGHVDIWRARPEFARALVFGRVASYTFCERARDV